METFLSLSPYVDNAVSMAFGFTGALYGAQLGLKQWIALQAAPRPSPVLPEPKSNKPPPVSKWIAFRDLVLWIGLQFAVVWGIPMLNSPIILAAFWILFCGSQVAFMVHLSTVRASQRSRSIGWNDRGTWISKDLPSSSTPSRLSGVLTEYTPIMWSLTIAGSLITNFYLYSTLPPDSPRFHILRVCILQYIFQGVFVKSFVQISSQIIATASLTTSGAGLGYKWGIVGIAGFQLASVLLGNLVWFCRTFLKDAMAGAAEWFAKTFTMKCANDAVEVNREKSAVVKVQEMPKWIHGLMVIPAKGFGYLFPALLMVLALNVDWAIWEDSRSEPIPPGLVVTFPASSVPADSHGIRTEGQDSTPDSNHSSTPPALGMILIPSRLPPFPKPYFHLSLKLGILTHLIAIGCGISEPLYSGSASVWVIVLGVFARALRRGEAKKVWSFRRFWRLPITRVLGKVEGEGEDEKAVASMLVDVSDV